MNLSRCAVQYLPVSLCSLGTHLLCFASASKATSSLRPLFHRASSTTHHLDNVSVLLLTTFEMHCSLSLTLCFILLSSVSSYRIYIPFRSTSLNSNSICSDSSVITIRTLCPCTVCKYSVYTFYSFVWKLLFNMTKWNFVPSSYMSSRYSNIWNDPLIASSNWK